MQNALRTFIVILGLSASTMAAAEAAERPTTPRALFSLENLGFTSYYSQRDAANAILSADRQEGTGFATSPAGEATKTLLRVFAGGQSLLGDVLDRNTSSDETQ